MLSLYALIYTIFEISIQSTKSLGLPFSLPLVVLKYWDCLTFMKMLAVLPTFQRPTL